MQSTRTTLLLISFLLGISFIISGLYFFFNSFSASFLGDDWSLIFDVAKGGNPFSTGSIPFFRPLGALSLFIDYRIWGLHAAWYHVVNVLLHSVNAILLVWASFVLARLFSLPKTDRFIFSIFAGFLFLLSPVHAEPVSWISGRFDVLSVTWLLASFLVYLYFVELSKTTYLVSSIAFFFCAVFTKESVVTYPFLILLLHGYFFSVGIFGKGVSRITLTAPLWFFLVDGIYLVARHLWLGSLVGGYGAAVHGNLSFHTLFFNLGVYAVKSVIPLDFIPAITRWIGDPYILAHSAATLVVLAALYGLGRPLFMILRASPRSSEPRAGAVRNMAFIIAAMFFISLAPVINLWPQLWNPQCDRFFYLPSVFAMMFVAILPQCFGKSLKVLGYASLTLLIIIYGVLIQEGARIWNEAGKISRSIVSNLAKHENTGTLFIINLPDNINGAYIFRNSIEKAISLTTEKHKFDDVVVVSFYGLTSATENVTVNCLDGKLRIDFSAARYGPQFGMGTFSFNSRIGSENHSGAAIPNGGSIKNELWSLSNLKQEGFDLTFKALKPEDEVVYFSDGLLKKVDCEFGTDQGRVE